MFLWVVVKSQPLAQVFCFFCSRPLWKRHWDLTTRTCIEGVTDLWADFVLTRKRHLQLAVDMLSRTDDWFWSCEIPPFCLELRFRKDMFFLPLVECYFHHKPWKSTVCLAFLRGCSLFPVVLFMTGQFCL